MKGTGRRSRQTVRRTATEEIEGTVIRSAFENQARNQLRTARLLGIGRNAVRARLQSRGVLSSAATPRL